MSFNFFFNNFLDLFFSWAVLVLTGMRFSKPGGYIGPERDDEFDVTGLGLINDRNLFEILRGGEGEKASGSLDVFRMG